MKLQLNQVLAQLIGEGRLKEIGIDWNTRGYRDNFEVNLLDLPRPKLGALRTWLIELSNNKDIKGPKALLKDLDLFIAALTDGGNQKARTVSGFASLLTQYLRTKPHRLYKRNDMAGVAYTCFYVNEIEYHPPDDRRDYRTPARTVMVLLHHELGGRYLSQIVYHAEDIMGHTAAEVLVKSGFYVETEELRKAYLEEVQRFNIITNQIGKQYIAQGFGIDNLDGNEGSSNFSRYNDRKYTLNNTKVVIDVFYENEKENRQRNQGDINHYFWARAIPKAIIRDELSDVEQEDLEASAAANKKDCPVEQPEIPIHPFCAVFDLRRHLRLRVHINYLTEYQWDKNIGKNLILPQITKDLVTTLIAQSKIGFADIIEGKGQGISVLLGGPPGVGKTLTAEVFAEASQKPLYSIQAAQLGIKADHIEQNLVRFLARGSRWNAIILIDEADVYIRSRDTDMEHNAVVASILRVLEYQTAVLFMTTNRADIVDDAIISRCIARIDYDIPTPDEQILIWRVLCDLNGLKLISNAMIAEYVRRHDNLAGRDIKQLLKLALLHRPDGKITPSVIDFVAQFQPTIGLSKPNNTPVERMKRTKYVELKGE